MSSTSPPAIIAVGRKFDGKSMLIGRNASWRGSPDPRSHYQVVVYGPLLWERGSGDPRHMTGEPWIPLPNLLTPCALHQIAAEEGDAAQEEGQQDAGGELY